MVLNEWLNADFVASIPYIKDNEADASEFIYAYIRAEWGKRTVSPVVDTITDKTTIAHIIDLIYRDKWKTIKEVVDNPNGDFDATGTKDTGTKTIEQTIYGYNGDGAKDYKQTITDNTHTTFNNLFEMIENNVAMRDKLSYYRVIAQDCADVLTTYVYESEV